MSKNIRNTRTDQRINEINDALQVINNDITNIENNIVNIQNNIINIEGDITTIENNISTIENNITVIEGDVINLDNRTTIIEGNVSVIQTNITTLNGDVSNVEDDIIQLQADVLALQTNSPTYFGTSGTLNIVENNLGTGGIISYRAHKINNIVTLTIYYYLSTMTNIRYWTSTTPLPAALFPITPSLGPVICHVGNTIGLFDSDIIGGCVVMTNGLLQIYRELPPGTGTWNANNCGWYTFSISYPTA